MIVLFAAAAGGAGGGPEGCPIPTPTIVRLAGFGAGGLGGGLAFAGAAPPGADTRKECPHFGHRIFRPAGGTRRSSI
jgi:hypothetical protein